jgi:hypothetical protein
VAALAALQVDGMPDPARYGSLPVIHEWASRISFFRRGGEINKGTELLRKRIF